MPILLYMTKVTKRSKTGGRAPARAAEFHNVTLRMSPKEHRDFRVAVAHSGIAGGGGAFVAMLTRDYLDRNGVHMDGDDEREGHTT